MHRFNSPLILAFSLFTIGMLVVIGSALLAPHPGERLVASAGAQGIAAERDHEAAIALPTPSLDLATSVAVRAATATPSPTQTPIPTDTPTATPAQLFAPVEADVTLDGIRHVWQTWNNCGPATLTMNLSYFGHMLDQAEVGASLRRHADDKNVSPAELAAYARSRGFHAEVRVNGSPQLLRTLLSNGIPVLIETWHEDETGDGLGHYRFVIGYDDAAGHWIAYDTFDATDLVNPAGPYAGVRIPYGELDRLWRFFNRTYLLLYPTVQTELIAQIMSAGGQADTMWVGALAVATAETAANPDDAIAWFNQGSSANALGETTQAAAAFDRARALGLPWRMFWYQFGAFEAYAAEARYADLLALADETLAGTASIEELHYWRGVALAGLGEGDAAQAAWRQAIALNPTFQPAVDALAEF